MSFSFVLCLSPPLSMGKKFKKKKMIMINTLVPLRTLIFSLCSHSIAFQKGHHAIHTQTYIFAIVSVSKETFILAICFII